MKYSLFKRILTFIVMLLVLLSCEKDENENPGNSSNVVFIEDDISSVTTWYSDSVYVIKNPDLYVLNSLTIQAGTVIKFHPDGQGMNLGSGGTLLARGTSSAHIIFTSWKDDSAGGDTNGDSNLTVPSVKDWGCINTNGENGSVFEYCEFHYGGGYSYSSTLDIYGNNISVKNCIFSYNSGDDPSGWYGALDAGYAGADCIITGNIFYSNYRPLSVGTLHSIDDSNIFHNPEAPSVTNTCNGIFVDAINEITSDISWGETEVAFVIDDTDFWTYNGGTLTLGDQVVLKFRPDSEMVLDNGASDLVNYDGPGVFFTSYKDDSKKGDTNGDGNTTTPSNGDWLGIYDNLNGVMFDWANILYESTTK